MSTTTPGENKASLNVQYAIGVICQYVLIAVLGLAVVGKIMEPQTSIDFIAAVLDSGAALSKVVLLLTIIGEGFLLVSLLFFGKQKWPFYATAGVMGIFSLLILYGIIIDLPALCGCFGSVVEETAVNQSALIRNIFLVVIAALAPGLKK